MTALKENISLRASAQKHGVSEEDFNNWVKPEEMICCTEDFKAGARRDCEKKNECKRIPPPPEVMAKKDKKEDRCIKKQDKKEDPFKKKCEP